MLSEVEHIDKLINDADDLGERYRALIIGNYVFWELLKHAAKFSEQIDIENPYYLGVEVLRKPGRRYAHTYKLL